MERSNDIIRLCGTLAGKPEYSHTTRKEKYYKFPLSVQRLSGTEDVLNVLAAGRQLEALEAEEQEKLFVSGEIRSYNNHTGVGAKLVISVLAREMYFTDADFENTVHLSGTLCRDPVLRRTPMGREICDMMLAVNRRFGRSDYLPCIAWGSAARAAARLETGARLSLTGRLQSRAYIKVEGDVSTEKTAYEVSAMTITAEK